MQKERSIGTLTPVGGNLCCNFINTVYAWRGNNLHEYFETYDDFIAWCIKLQVGSSTQLNTLQNQAKQKPKASENALKKIKEIRLLLYRFLSATAAKNYKELKQLLPEVNVLISESMSHLGFELEKKRLILNFEQNQIDLLHPVWITIHSLYELLTAENADRIKECPRCGWIFLDTTKNGKRRWCAPAECGTADKMKRYYKRKKKAAGN